MSHYLTVVPFDKKNTTEIETIDVFVNPPKVVQEFRTLTAPGKYPIRIFIHCYLHIMTEYDLKALADQVSCSLSATSE